MQQRFGKRYIRVPKIDILADHRNIDLAFRILLCFDDRVPLTEIGYREVQAQFLRNDLIQALIFHNCRNLVEIVDVIG